MSSDIKDLKKKSSSLKKNHASEEACISPEYQEELEKIRIKTHKKGRGIKIGTIRDFSKRYGLWVWLTLYNMHDLRIVHIGSFVLVYEIIETENTVLLLDYRHHDRVY